MVVTVAINPFYGEINPAQMAKLVIVEAVTKAVVAGADYHEMVLCDNFYTPRVRPAVAWELKQMVEAIADFSVAVGVPFISGKDSSSGTFESAGQMIDVPPTLGIAAVGRMPDVERIVTKEFKRAGNRIVLVGRVDPESLGGSVYADCHSQRGEGLFDPGGATSIRSVWDALLALRASGNYVSGSAIAEGGLALRLFEASFGSGLGARVEIPASISSRADGFLLGEFVGSVLIEITPDCRLETLLDGVPHWIIGEVTPERRLVLARSGEAVWQESTSALVEIWSRTLREIVA